MHEHTYTRTRTHTHAHTQAFGSPTIQAVVRHKWRLYARTRLVIRAFIYLFYTLANTVFAILYSKVGTAAVQCMKHDWVYGRRASLQTN